jgi:hypothetical protein
VFALATAPTQATAEVTEAETSSVPWRLDGTDAPGEPPPATAVQTEPAPAGEGPPALAFQAATTKEPLVGEFHRIMASPVTKPAEDETAPPAVVEAQDSAGGPTSTADPGAGPPRPQFIKGELVHVGTTRLLSRFDHFGVGLGANVIRSKIYAAVDPGLALYWDDVAVALHVPLNLAAVELQGTDIAYGGLRVRREDWDERADYMRVVRFVTLGRKEDNLYLSLNTMRPATIGHGMLMDNYQANMDVDRSMTNLLFDAYNRYGGFQFQINDVTLENQILGGLAFVKPLSLFSDDPVLSSLSLGIEYVGDFRAPVCIRLSAKDDATCLQGHGHQAGMNTRGEPLDTTFVRTDPDTGRYAVEVGTAHAAGLSAEMKLYRSGNRSDVKLYGTYHQFLNEGGGTGAGMGLLGRFNAGTTWIQAFRLRTEYRNVDDGFLPNYFGTLYELNKYEHGFGSRAHQVTPTKYQAIFGDPANGFARPSHGRRHGFRFDLSWGLFYKSRRMKQIAMGIGVSDTEGPFDSNMYMHVEFPAWGWLQVFASYLRVNARHFTKLFGPGMFKADDGVLLTGLRMQILPILFLNAHYSRSYSVVRSPGQEYHLGNDTVVDSNGLPSSLPQARLFENHDTLLVQLELGWEFDEDEEEN